MSGGLMVHGVLRAADAGADAIAFAGLAALVSPAPDGADDPERAMALARRHHEILCGVALSRDVLPVRLGAAFADSDALMRGLGPMADRFHAALAHCAGAVEMSLTVEDFGAPEVACEAAGGRDYLKNRAAALTAARERPARVKAALDALEAEVAGTARAVERRAFGAPRVRDLALLVQRGATQRVLDATERRRAGLAALGLQPALRGPWPVYSFANLPLASSP